MFDENCKTFIVHIATLEVTLSGMIIDPSRKTQIAALKQTKALTKVLTKYSDFSDVFSEKKALVLSEQINFNKNAIELKDDKQPL